MKSPNLSYIQFDFAFSCILFQSEAFIVLKLEIKNNLLFRRYHTKSGEILAGELSLERVWKRREGSLQRV